ncbi:MAG: hypothetical protein KF684_08565 [Phycisphaeraceae bacterium]|nr:hypothetical protein [Phycisphaeraceae bacterium]
MTDIHQQVAHTLRVGDLYLRIYRYAAVGTASFPGDAVSGTSHLVVFAREPGEFGRLDPHEHGFDPLELVDLIDATKVASVLTDLYEGRCTVFEAAEGLHGVQVEEIIEEGL